MSGTEGDREAQGSEGMRIHYAAAFSRKRPRPAVQDEITTQAENLAHSLSGWADWEDGAPEPLLRKTAAFLRKHYAPVSAHEHPSDTRAAEIIRKAAARIEELLPVEVAAGLPAAWREACAAICDRAAEANRRAAVEMGEALGDEAARKDERVISLWAAVHEAEELAAQIREIWPLDVASTAPQATEEPVAWDCLKQLRADGWSVAVHNDYRLDGEAKTFWLLTHASGRWIKGEGATDEEALRLALSQSSPTLYAAPAASRIGVSEEEIAKTLWDFRYGALPNSDWDVAKKRAREIPDGAAARNLNEAYETARALLAPPRAGGETGDGWSADMEAAPKDRQILLWSGIVMRVGWWSDELDSWQVGGENILRSPTHWRERPAPPADQNATQGEAR